MKAIKILIIPVILLAAFIVFHRSIQHNVLELGASWTFSSLSPYILQFVTAILLAAQISLLFKSKGRLISRLIFFLGILAFNGIAFAFNPVYEGDYSNTYKELSLMSNQEPIFKEGLTMVAMPGCPHCYSRIGTLNKLNERKPELDLHVLFIKNDSLAIEDYQEQLAADISVGAARNPKFVVEVVRGKFPAFLHQSNDAKTLYWEQKNFGNPALDWLEDYE